MNYGIYKLVFPYGVHFGSGLLESSKNNFMADTFFSALCIEALKIDHTQLDKLINLVTNGDLVFSDAFPFVGSDYLLPKPYLQIRKNENDDSTNKKNFKKMSYLAEKYFSTYLAGELNPELQINIEKSIGLTETKTSAAIRGNDETQPYRVGIFRFKKDAGLYIIYGYRNDESKHFFWKLLDSLSYSGIGGERSSGLGRFEIYNGKISDSLYKRLTENYSRYMTISTALPKDDELEKSMEDSSYLITRRGGFVSSEKYSDTYMRKKDLYVFSSGSTFKFKFQGDVYDVSSGGRHPVYRYAKPLFIGVQ